MVVPSWVPDVPGALWVLPRAVGGVPCGHCTSCGLLPLGGDRRLWVSFGWACLVVPRIVRLSTLSGLSAPLSLGLVFDLAEPCRWLGAALGVHGRVLGSGSRGVSPSLSVARPEKVWSCAAALFPRLTLKQRSKNKTAQTDTVPCFCCCFWFPLSLYLTLCMYAVE